jgi:hypothetical protein
MAGRVFVLSFARIGTGTLDSSVMSWRLQHRTRQIAQGCSAGHFGTVAASLPRQMAAFASDLDKFCRLYA